MECTIASTYFLYHYRNRGHQSGLSHPGPEYVNQDVVNTRITQVVSHQTEVTRNQPHGVTSNGSHRDPFDMSNIDYNLS